MKIGVELLFTVFGFTASLNVSTTGLFTATPVAPFAGLTEVTTGPVVTATVPVVKLLLNGDTVFPAWSVNPDTVTVYTVLTASGFVGVKVSVTRSWLRLTVPPAGCPPALTTIALLPTLTGSTGALTATTTCAFTGTPLA